jgi:hypothetical protein
VKQPHKEFLATKESHGDFKVVLNFKSEGYLKTGFVNSGYTFGASALAKLQSQN